ncbi:4-hydroxy-tetrahydrodipicolinate synthase [Hydrogenispora ethanolica]|jgi:4-hydroxy-tetrahydrodipicolinate synthase|uniref:4-hydroxy-tetrahydrodipicolinate synthase n=1 Tax=Hydrogenispora ethanolica TaxID=1082276 RepID=A0A4R1REB3_HYDET|nr:dihydrodipicolinate synthase family protein [Hydrogenispora ethanolica]TCL64254.1 4-hydroxy-tetrahydrodipicolinate synthase [Hydrogenispora ethanolica]
MDSQELHGVIVPLVTPLHNDETVDVPALRRVINYIIKGGVHGIFPLGTSGEFARLSDAERRTIMEVTIAETQQRVPVLVGISDTGLHRVIENLKIAESLGADAVVVSPPYYYPVHDDAEIVAFYSEVAERSSLPILLYNIPVTCGTNISLAALEQILSGSGSKIVGIKDSSGNRDYLQQIISRYHDNPAFRIFVGDESIGYEGLAAGAHGIVPSLGNVFPRLFVALYEAIRDGELSKARSIADQINAMNKMNLYSNSWMSAIVWRKAALSQLSLCGEKVTEPYIPITDAVRRDIAQMVAIYSENYGI